MDQIRIELTDVFNTFKAYYYRHGEGSIFTYQGTRKSVIITSIFAFLSIILYFIALQFPEVYWIFLFFIFTMITIIGIIISVINVKKYYERKKGIDEYLEGLHKYESQWLTYAQHFFELSSTEGSTIEKWETIKYVSIQSDHILMKSDNHGSYLIPEKTMKPEQFAELKEFIMQRMKDEPAKVQLG